MKPDECIQIFVPLKVRKQNGRPKIMPPATYLPSEDRTQDPHILRAIGQAWGWRRRMEAGGINYGHRSGESRRAGRTPCQATTTARPSRAGGPQAIGLQA